MPFDLARARRETPGCERVLHFNNAGAALMPRPVLDATVAHLELEAQIGGYEAADRAHDAVERVYDAAAALLNCHPDEIAVVENATRAWTWPSTPSRSAPATASSPRRPSTPATT